MFKDYLFYCSEIFKGKSVLRAFLNNRLAKETIKGDTIDIGGGGGDSYISFVNRSEDVTFQTFDLKVGSSIDFEKDNLPALNGTYDTVLFLNVMEHIFNYQHIADEVVRITKPGGQLIGFVPFLMWYHPDHRDFFRYTHEALQIIFEKTGATNIKIDVISKGPFIAGAQMILLVFPKILRVPIFTVAYFLDTVYLKLRTGNINRYALGYFFVIDK
jgi:SAM-dependent methyltransferase